jgi:hypothetical protein
MGEAPLYIQLLTVLSARGEPVLARVRPFAVSLPLPRSASLSLSLSLSISLSCPPPSPSLSSHEQVVATRKLVIPQVAEGSHLTPKRS